MITVVYGHPYDGSFNAAIRDTVLATLRESGREPALIDLYADAFDPAVRAPELALYGEGCTCDALAQRYMDILRRTDEIIYIFPVWWGTEPAIVNGFHDKVLLKGFAWSYGADGSLSPRLAIRRTTLFTTSEAPSASRPISRTTCRRTCSRPWAWRPPPGTISPISRAPRPKSAPPSWIWWRGRCQRAGRDGAPLPRGAPAPGALDVILPTIL